MSASLLLPAIIQMNRAIAVTRGILYSGKRIKRLRGSVMQIVKFCNSNVERLDPTDFESSAVTGIPVFRTAARVFTKASLALVTEHDWLRAERVITNSIMENMVYISVRCSCPPEPS